MARYDDTGPASEVRRLMARYPTSLERTRAALEAALAPPTRPFTDGEPRCTTCYRASHHPGDWNAGHDFTYPDQTPADVLSEYGFTAQDVTDAIREGGSIEVTYIDPEATS